MLAFVRVSRKNARSRVWGLDGLCSTIWAASLAIGVQGWGVGHP
jgi:hypothetical protein